MKKFIIALAMCLWSFSLAVAQAEVKFVDLGKLICERVKIDDHKIEKGQTLSGICKIKYGFGGPMTYGAVAKFNKIIPSRLKVGQIVKLPEPLILTQTRSGNGTKVSLNKAVKIALEKASEVLGTLGIETLITDETKLQVVQGLIEAKAAGQTRDVEGKVCLATTFWRYAVGPIKIATGSQKVGSTTRVNIGHGYYLQITQVDSCKNVVPELLQEVKQVIIPEPVTQVFPPPMMLAKFPAPHERGKISLWLVEKEGFIEAILEYHFSHPLHGTDAYGHSQGNQISVYSDRSGDVWFGPALMGNFWKGEFPGGDYRGWEYAQGLAGVWRKPEHEVKAHIYIGDMMEKVTVGSDYKIRRKFYDILYGDLSASAKAIRWVVPFIEEVSAGIFGKLDVNSRKIESYWQNHKISGEEVGRKHLFGALANIDFKSVDIGDGFTITPRLSGEYDWNTYDHGYGPAVALTVGHRMVNPVSAGYVKSFPPYKFLTLGGKLDLKREAYDLRIILFVHELYYVCQDRELRKLLLSVFGLKNNSQARKRLVPVAEKEKEVTGPKLIQPTPAPSFEAETNITTFDSCEVDLTNSSEYTSRS